MKFTGLLELIVVVIIFILCIVEVCGLSRIIYVWSMKRSSSRKERVLFKLISHLGGDVK